MKVHVFRARTVAEALERVRHELGQGAMIIETSGGGGAVEIKARHATLPAVPAPDTRGQDGRANRDAALDILVAEGIDPSTARRITGQAMRHGGLGELRRQLAGLVHPRSRDSFELQAGRVIACVGPTGVGKTTTIAKLATLAVDRQGLPAALITLDSSRVAAADQLRAHADALGMPCHVVGTPAGLRRVLARYGDDHLCLVDTAGRSQFDTTAIRGLDGFLRPIPGAQVQLVLPATASPAALRSAVHRFGMLPISALTFTKLDEAPMVGDCLNLCVETGQRVGYIAAGPRVPEDLWPGSGELLVDFVLGPEQTSKATA